MKDAEIFDMIHVPLQGKNLVEASAGTGKTFSIALLTLRLIIEKNINIKNILLVTFTKNAVAELDERIRVFIRRAKSYIVNGTSVDKPIQSIVDNGRNLLGEKEVLSRLNESILFLDETSVMTIHSFCKKTLSYLAFETGQNFESELVTNIEDILDNEINKFWSYNIIALPIPVLEMLVSNKFGRNSIRAVIKNYLEGKIYYQYNEKANYVINDSSLNSFQNFKIEKENFLQSFRDYVERNRTTLSAAFQGRYVDQFLKIIDQGEALLKLLLEKSDKKYFDKLPNELKRFTHQYSEFIDKEQKENQKVSNLILCRAIQEISQQIKIRSSREGVTTFNDLIQNLSDALNGPNHQKIVNSLRKEYQAIFIDEFQDTDKLQYEIFMKSFSDSILFLIGDPKQSIYGFRKADIYTYFKAYENVDHRYTMNTNFRSSENMIRSMNQFFLPSDDFDTFAFSNEKNGIKYLKVQSPDPIRKLPFTKEGKPLPGISIYLKPNKTQIVKSAANRILKLLTDKKYQITETEKERCITPHDIGILVRNNDYGIAIQKELEALHIPSVFVSEQKIMQSQEAAELIYVLKAMFDPRIETINAAVANRFTNYKPADVPTLDEEKLIELFRSYKLKWETEGVYNSISAYIRDLGITEYLRKNDTPEGLRILANLNQLTELLSRQAYHQHLKQAELLNWYMRSLELDLVEEDEGEIRLESDSNAVTIMTIHKSKGLEFNIVFAIQMDLSNNVRGFVNLYQENDYILIPANAMNEAQKELAAEQAEQENRRLMYVAITRAAFKAYLYKNTFSRFAGSGFSEFLNRLTPGEDIEIIEEENENQTDRYLPGENITEPKPAKLTNTFFLPDQYWRKTSYSGLAAQTHVPVSDINSTTAQTDYENFIFSTLRKGEITGNMIHDIMRKIDFTNSAGHEKIISYSVNRYAASKSEDYLKHLPQLLENILYSDIPTHDGNLQLNKIPLNNRVSEMEFNFNLEHSNIPDIVELLSNENIPVQFKSITALQGMMNGFIDLFFEYRNKYYVLDWKTNYLGNSPEQYNSESVKNAMESNNYHLQYIIYTLAVKKYLSYQLVNFSYDDFGGVIYCFVRGMRKDKNSGIFFTRPSENLTESLEKIFGGKANIPA